MPPEATKHTEEGAKAFAALYVQVADEALVEADPSGLLSISSPGCKGCQVFTDWASTLRKEKRHHAKRSLVLKGQLLRPDSTADVVVIDLLIQELAVDVLDDTGVKVASEPAQKATLRTTFTWSRAGWRVTESLLVKG